MLRICKVNKPQNEHGNRKQLNRSSRNSSSSTLFPASSCSFDKYNASVMLPSICWVHPLWDVVNAVAVC